MMNYVSSNEPGFKTAIVDIAKIAGVFKNDGYPNHIGIEAGCPANLPLSLKQRHADSYWSRYAEVDADKRILRPLLRRSTAEERADGDGPLQLLDGRHRLAVLRDYLGISQIEIEVPWNEVAEFEALYG